MQDKWDVESGGSWDYNEEAEQGNTSHICDEEMTSHAMKKRVVHLRGIVVTASKLRRRRAWAIGGGQACLLSSCDDGMSGGTGSPMH
jgi:hypothetical protein